MFNPTVYFRNLSSFLPRLQRGEFPWDLLLSTVFPKVLLDSWLRDILWFLQLCNNHFSFAVELGWDGSKEVNQNFQNLPTDVFLLLHLQVGICTPASWSSQLFWLILCNNVDFSLLKHPGTNKSNGKKKPPTTSFSDF